MSNYGPTLGQANRAAVSSTDSVLELARREAEKSRTLKEMSQGGQSQTLEWAMVHTLAWKHDIAEGGKNTILSFSAIRTLSPCQTCHMSPSQVVLLAYRVWQGYSHTAPNQTPSPAEKKKNHHHSTVTGCQAEGTNLHRAWAESLPIWGRGQRPGVTMGETPQACAHHHAHSSWWQFSFVVQSVTRQGWNSSS